MKTYRRISLDDRRIIEESLNNCLSFRHIGTLIDKSVSVVAYEVKRYRTIHKTKAISIPCKDHKYCKRTNICTVCHAPGSVCAVCSHVLCKEVCDTYLLYYGCKHTQGAPWVCNGCKKLKFGCNRSGRYKYIADVADRQSKEIRSASRRGINMNAARFAFALSIIRDGLARKLSPYEIATLYADSLSVSVSTMYRWIERGYGGLANIELERKVGFRPRREHKTHKTTHHGKKRSYEAFLRLSKDIQDGCIEMDTVVGKKTDSACLLTLYIRPAHFQLYVLLKSKTAGEVVKVFDEIEQASRHMFEALFSVILTDNGPEFEDPEALEKSVYEGFPKRCQVFFCDPRQSQQKGRCEKNHSELRQLLPKGKTTMDNLTLADVADINCQINSTPRKSLCGMSPIEMLFKAYGDQASEFLDLFSIAWLDRDDIDLSPIDTNSTELNAGGGDEQDQLF